MIILRPQKSNAVMEFQAGKKKLGVPLSAIRRTTLSNGRKEVPLLRTEERRCLRVTSRAPASDDGTCERASYSWE